MLKKVKHFVRDHKGEIMLISAGAGAIVIGFAVGKMMNSDLVRMGKNVDGKSVISWRPNGNFINLEEVKGILEANKDNMSQFALFREGGQSDDYVCVLLSNDVVMPVLSEGA